MYSLPFLFVGYGQGVRWTVGDKGRAAYTVCLTMRSPERDLAHCKRVVESLEVHRNESRGDRGLCNSGYGYTRRAPLVNRKQG